MFSFSSERVSSINGIDKLPPQLQAFINKHQIKIKNISEACGDEDDSLFSLLIKGTKISHVSEAYALLGIASDVRDRFTDEQRLELLKIMLELNDNKCYEGQFISVRPALIRVITQLEDEICNSNKSQIQP